MPVRVARMSLFLSGYLLAWAGCGAVAFAMLAGTGRLTAASPTAIIFTEKLWRHGRLLGRAVGILLLAAGFLAIWFPWLLPGLLAAGMPAM